MSTSHGFDALDLSDAHREMLEASGITAEVAAARGYLTVAIKAELERLGFSRTQARVPTLLVPVWGVFGDEPVTYQHRPDRPRQKKGKALKYETPSGGRLHLDVPPGVREKIGDPSVPLFITEGAKKADSAVCHGLCCIALLGVWGWRGKNEHGGITALADWESVTLKGRTIYIAFDSDVMEKPQVNLALVRFADFLASRGGIVKIIYLPPAEDGSKVGLDDFFVAGGDVERLLSLAEDRPRDVSSAESSGRYRVDSSGNTVYLKPVGEGIVEERLANFSAQITGEVLHDDGIDLVRHFELTVKLGDQDQSVQVPGCRFQGMGWVTDELGADLIVSAGFGAKDKLREAIQELSPRPIPKRNVYTHTGWTQIEGEWVYLHAGGGIGERGAIDDIEVELPQALDHHELPPPRERDRQADAVRHTLAMLDGVGPDEVVFPLFSQMVIPPLGEVNFSSYILGSTGTFKSTFAAYLASSFGRYGSADDLKVGWSSTANFIEETAFCAKDSLLVVDDFNPVGTRTDVAAMHRAADRVFRAVGNQVGRGRLTAESKVRPTHPPRGALLSTGEDLPSGQSMRARLVVVEVGQETINIARLAELGREREKLRQSMSGFVRALAPSMGSLQKRRADFVTEHRDLFSFPGCHPRVASNAAGLLFGLVVYVQYAVHVGAISEEEGAKLRDRGVAGIQACAKQQAAYQAASNPAEQFVQAIGQVLRSGQGHLVDRHGGEKPDDDGIARLVGWRTDSVGGAGEWRPQGKKVGWIDASDNSIYLLPTVSLAAVRKLDAGSAEGITVSRPMLSKHLHERGYLRSSDGDRSSKSIRVEGMPTSTWHLALEGVLTDARTTRTAGTDAPEGVQEPHSLDPGLGFGGPNNENTVAEEESGEQPVRAVPVVLANAGTPPARNQNRRDTLLDETWEDTAANYSYQGEGH